MQNLPWHPHYDVWALIFSLVIFFEFSTKNKSIKGEKRKLWYSGIIILWIFTDYPLHDIGEKYLFSVHSVEHLVLALVSPPLLLLGMHKEMKKIISIKPFISILKFTSKPVVAFFLFNFRYGRNALVFCCKFNGDKYSFSFCYTFDYAPCVTKYVDSCNWI
jgi:putative membrane protein